MKTPRVESYRDEDGQFRTRLVARNGRIVLPLESHADRTKAKRAMRAAQRLLADPTLRWVDVL